MIDVKMCRSEKLNTVSFGAEMLWTRLLTNLDDNGNYDRDALVVYAACLRFKAGVTIEQVECWLKELIDVRSDGELGLISEYESKGRKYIHLTDFHLSQHLRDDKIRTIEYPVHPEELENKAYLRTGIGRSVDRTHTVRIPPTDGPRPVPKTGSLPPKDRPEVEVEVEVEESKREGEEEVSFIRSDEGVQNQKHNFGDFRAEFRTYTGVRLKPFPKLIEQCDAAINRHGWETICTAMKLWTEDEGGRDVTKKNKYASKNFFESLDEIVEEIRRPIFPKNSETELVQAPSGISERSMR